MERNTLFFFGGKRRSPSAKPSRRSQGEEGGGRGARLRHRFADPRPPSAVVRHERDPCPWSCRPSFGTDLRELREHLRRCLLWVLEGRGRLVVGPHGPAAPHEGVKDSRSGLHTLSLSLSLSLSLARAPLPLVFSLCRPCVNAQRFKRCVLKTHSLPPSLTPLAIEFEQRPRQLSREKAIFWGGSRRCRRRRAREDLWRVREGVTSREGARRRREDPWVTKRGTHLALRGHQAGTNPNSSSEQ